MKPQRSPRRCTYIPLAMCSLMAQPAYAMSEVSPHSPKTGSVDLRGASGSSGIAIYEHSKLLPWLLSIAMFSAAALVTAIFVGLFCWSQMQDYKREQSRMAEEYKAAALQVAKEYKQIQIQLMYANAIMLREGIVKDGDMVYGPEGNLMYKQHQLIPVKPKEK